MDDRSLAWHCPSEGEAAVSETETRATVNELYDAYRRHDATRIAEMVRTHRDAPAAAATPGTNPDATLTPAVHPRVMLD